eukprot:TRINITY_DN1432_c0_g1_i1.p1 TRINITY_DN1432_c0_g1~~TRINITY_DN1432_c0_g1_i1.p1  ORF type:complete len:225 (+),score=61.50 TRINITY_DN1432_c0_g1_i1:38-712(+)
MVKFSQVLSSNSFEPWAEYYCSYKAGKRLIETFPADGIEENSPDHLQFIQYFEQQKGKVFNFYNQKLKEFNVKVLQLRDEYLHLKPLKVKIEGTFGSEARNNLLSPALQALETKTSKLYDNLSYFQEYCDLNFTAFKKILRKFDRFAINVSIKDSYWPTIERSPISSDRIIRHLKEEIILMHASVFSLWKSDYSRKVLNKENTPIINDVTATERSAVVNALKSL